jgi:hypothetical protein
MTQGLHIFAQFDRLSSSLEVQKSTDNAAKTIARLFAQGRFITNPDMENERFDTDGDAYLDVVLCADATDHGAGTVTSLTGEGDSYELTVAYPLEFMGWAERLIDGCSEQNPLTLQAHLPEQQPKRVGLVGPIDAVGRLADMVLESATLRVSDRVRINGLFES